MSAGRFAPSPTGQAHPGTLLSGLLAWLDARKAGARFILRLEDLDPDRVRPQWSTQMLDDLRWLGLDWDELVVQSERGEQHAAALDRLAELGVLYPCTCSRARIKASAARAADGGFVYPGTCRDVPLPSGGWRAVQSALRVRLPETAYTPRELFPGSALGEAGASCFPAREMGDPVVRRQDGTVTYNLAVVVDDIAAGVDRVVRGGDLRSSTGVHLALYELLRAPPPSYWHHLLLLEESEADGDASGGRRKLAKLHAAIGAEEIRRHLSAQAVCGFLATAAGLLPPESFATPRDLLAHFDPSRVSRSDRLVRWTGRALALGEDGS